MSTPESTRKQQELKIGRKSFAGVSSFKHLGNVINNGNRIDNCVKKIIQDENMVYFANLSTTKSKII
jgi:hypothetical protein